MFLAGYRESEPINNRLRPKERAVVISALLFREQSVGSAVRGPTG